MTAAHAISETITAMGGVPRSVPDLIIASMAVQYGGPFDLGPMTPWHEIGTDICRMAMLQEVEDQFGRDLSDDQREGIRSVGDLIRLVEGGQR